MRCLRIMRIRLPRIVTSTRAMGFWQFSQKILFNAVFLVEQSKAKDDLIRVPVLYGENGKEFLSFEVDAYNVDTKTVVEVEAGRGYTNYQFLKDFFECCMMQDVDYFCVAIRKDYRGHKDFDSVCNFFTAMYASQRMILPLKGILVIGY